jgi:hypothetical protein
LKPFGFSVDDFILKIKNSGFEFDQTYLMRIKGVLAKEYNTPIPEFDNMFINEFNILINELKHARDLERQARMDRLGLVGN